MDRQIYPGLGFRSWLHITAAGLVMRSFSLVLLVLTGVFNAENRDGGWGVIVPAYLSIHRSTQFGLGMVLLGRLRILVPASDRLLSLVVEISSTVGVKPRRVWELASPTANALALVTTREHCFTTRLLAEAPDAELKTTCAHELGHLTESRPVIATHASPNYSNRNRRAGSRGTRSL